NIGGVANITFIGADGSLMAFDTGPGNALIDDWVRARTGAASDSEGALAAKGRCNEDVLHDYLTDPYFTVLPPKSLDRNAFNLDLCAQL
ncbi:anhydro-N-acetylmuramic acid kinase, partial [Acinetobacter baumannii]